MALSLPAHDLMLRLEMCQIDLELAGAELLVDFLVQDVAEPTGNRNLDAGIALLESTRACLPRGAWTAHVKRERAFRLGLLVKFVEGLRACRHDAEC